MGEIVFVRHGQASFGEADYDRLSKTGVEQAKILGGHLSRLEIRFDALYSGNMKRQTGTAQKVAEAYVGRGVSIPAVRLFSAFDEYDSNAVWESQIALMVREDPGLPERLESIRTQRGAFQDIFSQVVNRWVSGRHDRPGAPIWSEFQQRVTDGVQEIIRLHGAKKRLAVFSSGGPIAVAVQGSLGISDRKTIDLSWQIKNASVTRIKYNRQGTILSVFNDTTHLEREPGTGLVTYR